MSTMAKTWRVTSRSSGADLGTYEGASRKDVLDAMSRLAGYSDHEEACRATGDDCGNADLVVTEVAS